jgi:predicted HTH transcriptional regulator
VEKRFAGLGLNERQWQAVRQATEKGRFTLADYAGLVDMPSRTLQRDLKDLVGKGVFVKRGTARATWYEVKR